MSLYEHWQEGARAAHEELPAMIAAGARLDELTMILDRLTAAHGDNAGTPQDQARAAGYLQMTGDIVCRLLYERDAARDAEIEAGM